MQKEKNMDFEIRKTTTEDLKQLPDLYKSAFGKETNIPKMYKKFAQLKNSPRRGIDWFCAC